MEMGEHLLLELLDEHGVWPHEVLAGGQEVLRPDPHGGGVDPDAVPGAGHAQAHQQHQASDQEKDGPKRDHVITMITMTNILTRHGGEGQGSTELEFRLSKILEG